MSTNNTLEAIDGIKPERLDRLDPHWVQWFIQTQKAAAAQALSQVEVALAQQGQMGGGMNPQIATNVNLLRAQAKTHLSVLALCVQLMRGPYWTRDQVDEALETALAEICNGSKTEEAIGHARSGLWSFCKALGIPLPKLPVH